MTKSLDMLVEMSKKYKGDELENQYKKSRYLSKSIREELKDIKGQDEKLSSMALVDGLISMPIILDILSELNELYKNEIFFQSDQLGLNLNGLIADKKIGSLDNIFEFYYNAEKKKNNFFHKSVKIEDIFKDELIKNYKTPINEEVIHKYYQTFVTRVMDALLSQVPKEKKDSLKSLEPLLMTYLYLIHANKVYGVSDEIQLKTLFELLGMLAKGEVSKDYIERNYTAVLAASKLIMVTNESKKLWEEMRGWLQGLHQRTYAQLPHGADGKVIKEADGTYPVVPGDDHDKKIKDNIKLTKYDIARLHQQHADNISSILPVMVKQAVAQSANQNTVLPVQIPVAQQEQKKEMQVANNQNDNNSTNNNNTTTATATSIQSQPAVVKSDNHTPGFVEQPPQVVRLPSSVDITSQPKSAPVYDENVLGEDDDNYFVVIKVPKEKKGLIPRIKQYAHTLIDSDLKQADEMQIPRELQAALKHSREEMIERLQTCVKKYAFSPEQQKDLKELISRRVDTDFQAYIGTGKSIYYGKAWVPNLLAPTHKDSAESKIAEVKNAPDAQTQLKILFEFRAQLKKDLSGNLLPALDRILESVCLNMIDRLPQDDYKPAAVSR